MKLIQISGGIFLPIEAIRQFYVKGCSSKTHVHSFVILGNQRFPFLTFPIDYFSPRRQLSKRIRVADIRNIHRIALKIMENHPEPVVLRDQWKSKTWHTFLAYKDSN